VLGEEGDGEVAGLGGGVGGAAGGEFIGRGEKVADGGLGAPRDELAEGELVNRSDFDQRLVGLEEIVQEPGRVDREVVDGGVDL
jgi:hypothetical protein